jgi:hypothetical protein
MLTRLIALLVFSGVLGVFGQDAPTPVSHTFRLEHVSIHGRITGIVDGDTINVRILGKQQIRSVSRLSMRRRKASRSVSKRKRL